jgi:RNAse (barnase) inhibitor barstar
MINISAEKIKTKDQLFRLIADGMKFPGYFGMNWDALFDCLTDMSWLPANGYTLYVSNADQLWNSNKHDAGMLVEIWLSAAEFWAQQQVPFHLVFIW